MIQLFSQRYPYGHGQPVAERTSRMLDPRHCLRRVPAEGGTERFVRAKVTPVYQAQLHQDGGQPHGTMSFAEKEVVPIGPSRILRIDPQDAAVQDCEDLGFREHAAEVPTACIVKRLKGAKACCCSVATQLLKIYGFSWHNLLLTVSSRRWMNRSNYTT